jgi:hypothetical protein
MPLNHAPHLVHSGDRFGRLTVQGFHHNDKRHRRHYTVICDCGVSKTVQGTLLRAGNTKSCGCGKADAYAKRRIPGNHSEITAIILGYKRHARARGFSWNLTRAEVEAIVVRPCFYCGSPPQNVKIHKNTVAPFAYSGIDRVDNTLGYSVGNVAPCCRICNRAKETLTLQEFAEWANRIAAMADQWGNPESQEAA